MSKARRRRRAPWVVMMLLVALAVVLAGIFPYRQILAQERVVDLKRTQLSALEAENQRLRSEVDRLQTADEIERLARERFGFVRPGEVQYVVAWDEEPEAAPLPGPPAAPSPAAGEDSSWWDALWGFITGADLERGG